VRFVIDLPDPKKYRDQRHLEKAERQRWRALLLVIKAKLEAVESAITAFDEEFLAHIVMPNDRTVADLVHRLVDDAYRTGRMPALGPAPADVVDGAVVARRT
jgi:hypothetical protein